MKKLFASLLLLTLSCSLASCNTKENVGDKPGDVIPPITDDEKPNPPVDDEKPTPPVEEENPTPPSEEEKIDYIVTEEEFNNLDLLKEEMFSIESDVLEVTEGVSREQKVVFNYKNKSLYFNCLDTTPNLENNYQDTVYTIYNEENKYDEYSSYDNEGFDEKVVYDKFVETLGYNNYSNFIIFKLISFNNLEFNKENHNYILKEEETKNDIVIKDASLEFLDNKLVSFNCKFDISKQNIDLTAKVSYENVADIIAPKLNNFEVTKEIIDIINLNELNNFSMNYKNTYSTEKTTYDELIVVRKLDDLVYGKVDSPYMLINTICKLLEDDNCKCYMYGNSYDELCDYMELKYSESPFYIYLNIIDNLLRQDFSKYNYNKENKVYDVTGLEFNFPGQNSTFNGQIGFKNNKLVSVKGHAGDNYIDVTFTYNDVIKEEIVGYEIITDENFENNIFLGHTELAIEIIKNRKTYHFIMKDNSFKITDANNEAIYYGKFGSSYITEYTLNNKGEFVKSESALDRSILFNEYLRDIMLFQRVTTKDIELINENLNIYKVYLNEYKNIGFRDNKLAFISDNYSDDKLFIKYISVEDIVIPEFN